MSCDIDSDSFHTKIGQRELRPRTEVWTSRIKAGTKKGGRRKTVSSRRAYVMTPSSLIKKIRQIEFALQMQSGTDTKRAAMLLSELRSEIEDSR